MANFLKKKKPSKLSPKETHNLNKLYSLKKRNQLLKIHKTTKQTKGNIRLRLFYIVLMNTQGTNNTDLIQMVLEKDTETILLFVRLV